SFTCQDTRRTCRNKIGASKQLVHTNNLNGNAVTDPKSPIAVTPDQRMRIWIELIVIVRNFGNGDKSLDEEINQLDCETVPPNANDDGIECLAEMLLHEKHFLPLEQLAFGLIRFPLALAGFAR